MARPRSPSTAAMVPAIPPAQSFLWPALTVLPFLRRPIGEYIVRPKLVITSTLLLLYPVPAIISAWCHMQGSELPRSDFLCLSAFGAAYGVTALFMWSRRWHGVWRSEEVHGAETGVSWLAEHLPAPCTSSEGIIMPVLVTVAGFIVLETVSV